jgi:hypothetical protein
MKKITKIVSIACFLALLTPSMSFAAEIFFETQKNNFTKNEKFSVQVFLNTENVSVNAIEGSIIFPVDLLEVEEIIDGNSAINFWVEKPYITDKQMVSFSGITTGGLNGSKKFMFSIIFVAKATGNGFITFSEIEVLKNDGLGTKIKAVPKPLLISVDSKLSSIKDENGVKDPNSPEDFIPIVGRDPTIFDGQYFVVFSTQDKGLGVDYYEVKEGFWGSYAVASSPYLLQDQSLTKTIYVKAVDRGGNMRVVTVSAQNHPKWYQDYFIISIIVLLFGWLFFSKKYVKN